MKILIALLFAPTIALAAIQKLQPTGGLVEFLAIGKPSFIKIHGKGSPSAGNISLEGDKVSGSLEFDLSSLDTEIATRDKHMKEKYLEVDKYPKAKLELKSVKFTPGWSLQKPKMTDADFEGVLTVHGQEKPVSGKVSIDDKTATDVKFKIKLSDFKIDIPSFAGVTVADDVEVTVKFDKLGVL